MRDSEDVHQRFESNRKLHVLQTAAWSEAVADHGVEREMHMSLQRRGRSSSMCRGCITLVRFIFIVRD